MNASHGYVYLDKVPCNPNAVYPLCHMFLVLYHNVQTHVCLDICPTNKNVLYALYQELLLSYSPCRISKPSLFHPLITSASSISCKNVSSSSSSVSSNIVSSNLSTIVCASAFVSVLGLVNQTWVLPIQSKCTLIAVTGKGSLIPQILSRIKVNLNIEKCLLQFGYQHPNSCLLNT